MGGQDADRALALWSALATARLTMLEQLDRLRI